MTGFSQIVLLGTSRVRTTFVDQIGNPKPILGTGFWFAKDGTADPEYAAFATNRHNVDPRLTGHAWRTRKVEIELRHHAGPSEMAGVRQGASWCEVSNLGQALFAEDRPRAPDCAVIFRPELVNRPDDVFAHVVLQEAALATEAKFAALSVGEAASFIGYAGQSERNGWWDHRWMLPISRPAWLASWPAKPFNHRGIATEDVLLVSGLSFHGSSGSPVIAHATPTSPASVIGIMSGHWDEPGAAPVSLPQHSGLSYLTRSTAILALVATARASGFRALSPYSVLETAPPGDVIVS